MFPKVALTSGIRSSKCVQARSEAYKACTLQKVAAQQPRLSRAVTARLPVRGR